MKRRNFLKKLPLAASIPFTLNGIPIKVLADNHLARLAQMSTNDRVLILLQMHGGNDGLNSVIPVAAYNEYYNVRSNIAIPEKKMIPLDSTLAENVQVGLHPEMGAMKAMYDQGRIKIVQGVSYKNNNGSHFRGRDIWFMGGGADDYYSSGWVGRYLENEFPNYPDDYPNPDMEDPLALEMGSDISLIFHQSNGFPSSISLYDPEAFADLVENLDGFVDKQIDPRGFPPPGIEDSPYGKELRWILDLEKKTDDYAKRLLDLFIAGKEGSVVYPSLYPHNAPEGAKVNRLAPQLRLIARLLAGGCKTKVFLVKVGGFDTHADQVEDYDPTMGVHAALMYHISSAMKAFHDDLRARGAGLEDKVITVTTSEFGRRIHSNGSFGTDHGTGGPTFIFGKGVVPGVLGNTPDLDTQNGNINMQYDYRLIYANIMKDWLGVSDDNIDKIFPGIMSTGTTDEVQFEPLPIANNVIAGNKEFIGARYNLAGCYPNPTKGMTTVQFKTNMTGLVTIDLFDNQGKKVKVLVNDEYVPGEYQVEHDLSNLPAGSYIYQMQVGFFKDAKKLVIIH